MADPGGVPFGVSDERRGLVVGRLLDLLYPAGGGGEDRLRLDLGGVDCLFGSSVGGAAGPIALLLSRAARRIGLLLGGAASVFRLVLGGPDEISGRRPGLAIPLVGFDLGGLCLSAGLAEHSGRFLFGERQRPLGLLHKSLGVRQRSLLLFSERLGSRYVS
jgi:hypothetical protein